MRMYSADWPPDKTPHDLSYDDKVQFNSLSEFVEEFPYHIVRWTQIHGSGRDYDIDFRSLEDVAKHLREGNVDSMRSIHVYEDDGNVIFTYSPEDKYEDWTYDDGTRAKIDSYKYVIGRNNPDWYHKHGPLSKKEIGEIERLVLGRISEFEPEFVLTAPIESSEIGLPVEDAAKQFVLHADKSDYMKVDRQGFQTPEMQEISQKVIDIAKLINLDRMLENDPDFPIDRARDKGLYFYVNFWSSAEGAFYQVVTYINSIIDKFDTTKRIERYVVEKIGLDYAEFQKMYRIDSDLEVYGTINRSVVSLDKFWSRILNVANRGFGVREFEPEFILHADKKYDSVVNCPECDMRIYIEGKFKGPDPRPGKWVHVDTVAPYSEDNPPYNTYHEGYEIYEKTIVDTCPACRRETKWMATAHTNHFGQLIIQKIEQPLKTFEKKFVLHANDSVIDFHSKENPFAKELGFERFVESWPAYRRTYPNEDEVAIRVLYDLYYDVNDEETVKFMEYLLDHSYKKEEKPGREMNYVSVKDVDAYHSRFAIPQYRKEFILHSSLTPLIPGRPGRQMIEAFRRRGLTLRVATLLVEEGHTISGMKNVTYQHLQKEGVTEKDIKRICKAFDIPITKSIPTYAEEFVLHSFHAMRARTNKDNIHTMHNILKEVRGAWLDTWHGIYGRLDRGMPKFQIRAGIESYWVGAADGESEIGMLESMIHGHAGLLAEDSIESTGMFKSKRGDERFRLNPTFRENYNIGTRIEDVSPTASNLDDLLAYWQALSRLALTKKDVIPEYAPEFRLTAPEDGAKQFVFHATDFECPCCSEYITVNDGDFMLEDFTLLEDEGESDYCYYYSNGALPIDCDGCGATIMADVNGQIYIGDDDCDDLDDLDDADIDMMEIADVEVMEYECVDSIKKFEPEFVLHGNDNVPAWASSEDESTSDIQRILHARDYSLTGKYDPVVNTSWFKGYFFWDRESHPKSKDDFFYFVPRNSEDEVFNIVGKGIIKAWIALDYTGRNDMSHEVVGQVYRDNYNKNNRILRFKPDEGQALEMTKLEWLKTMLDSGLNMSECKDGYDDCNASISFARLFVKKYEPEFVLHANDDTGTGAVLLDENIVGKRDNIEYHTHGDALVKELKDEYSIDAYYVGQRVKDKFRSIEYRRQTSHYKEDFDKRYRECVEGIDKKSWQKRWPFKRVNKTFKNQCINEITDSMPNGSVIGWSELPPRESDDSDIRHFLKENNIVLITADRGRELVDKDTVRLVVPNIIQLDIQDKAGIIAQKVGWTRDALSKDEKYASVEEDADVTWRLDTGLVTINVDRLNEMLVDKFGTGFEHVWISGESPFLNFLFDANKFDFDDLTIFMKKKCPIDDITYAQTMSPRLARGDAEFMDGVVKVVLQGRPTVKEYEPEFKLSANESGPGVTDMCPCCEDTVQMSDRIQWHVDDWDDDQCFWEGIATDTVCEKCEAKFDTKYIGYATRHDEDCSETIEKIIIEDSEHTNVRCGGVKTYEPEFVLHAPTFYDFCPCCNEVIVVGINWYTKPGEQLASGDATDVECPECGGVFSRHYYYVKGDNDVRMEDTDVVCPRLVKKFEPEFILHAEDLPFTFPSKYKMVLDRGKFMKELKKTGVSVNKVWIELIEVVFGKNRPTLEFSFTNDITEKQEHAAALYLDKIFMDLPFLTRKIDAPNHRGWVTFSITALDEIELTDEGIPGFAETFVL